LNKKNFILVTALLLVLLGGGWLVKQRFGASSAQARAVNNSAAGNAAPATPAPAIIEFSSNDLSILALSDIARRIPITGTLQPANQTMVKSKVAGEIKQLLVREGIAVKAGQVIARIDPLEFEWRVREREAQLRSTEALLAQARQTLQNNRQLLEKNFISQNAFDNARFSLDSAQGNRDAALAQLTVARKALGDCTVLAPMSGLVGERFAQVGEKVSPDNRIVSIIDLSRMEIDAPVPASDIGSVSLGQSVWLSIEGIDEAQIGKVVRINPSTQAGTRSVPIHLSLENKDPRIRAGLFAQGQLVVGAKAAVITVPSNAIRDAAGRTFVYLIEGDRVIERDVEIGLRDESSAAANGQTGVVEIKRGLAVDDKIVAVNLGPLRGGSVAKISARSKP
jgi:membrane fusion protein, multidrug efflux system